MSGSGFVRIQTEEPFSLADTLDDLEQEDNWKRVTFDDEGYVRQLSAPAVFPHQNLKAFYAEQAADADEYTVYRVLSQDHPVTSTYPADEPPEYTVAVSTMDAPVGNAATNWPNAEMAARQFADRLQQYDLEHPVRMADQYAALDAFPERSRDDADNAFYAIPYDLKAADLPDPIAALQDDAYQ